MVLQHKFVHGVELVSNDGVNWGLATPAPLISGAESLMRAREFEAPIQPRRPFGNKKMVVRKGRTKRLMNAPIRTLRKVYHEAALAAAKRDTEKSVPALVRADKPAKPNIIIGGPVCLIHSYSDVRSHIHREWFNSKPTGLLAASVLASLGIENPNKPPL